MADANYNNNYDQKDNCANKDSDSKIVNDTPPMLLPLLRLDYKK